MQCRRKIIEMAHTCVSNTFAILHLEINSVRMVYSSLSLSARDIINHDFLLNYVYNTELKYVRDIITFRLQIGVLSHTSSCPCVAVRVYCAELLTGLTAKCWSAQCAVNSKRWLATGKWQVPARLTRYATKLYKTVCRGAAW